MRANRNSTIVLASLFLLSAAQLLAQTTGQIRGRVVDSADAPVQGATLAVTGPALPRAQTTVSGPDGTFRFFGLPPGLYELRLERGGSTVLTVSDIRVTADATVTTVLRMPTSNEVATADTSPGGIDVTSAAVSTHLDGDLVQQLPGPRVFQGFAFFAPGVVTGGPGDVGENNSSVAGASLAENQYVINGLDTTDVWFGTTAAFLPVEFVSDLEVKTAYGPEHGGALGGVLNVVTKSGGNTLRGDGFAYYTADDLQATRPSARRIGRDVGFTKNDVGVDAGGPISRDRVWFFGGLNRASTDNRRAGSQGPDG